MHVLGFDPFARNLPDDVRAVDLDAVESGKVRAAALDSVAVEPMAAGHPFQKHKGFILSPHIGGVTSDAYVSMGVAAARNALQVLARQPLLA